MIKFRQINLLPVLLLLLQQTLSADPLYNASELEKDGRLREAYTVYETWLDENKTDPRFTDVLFKTASLAENADEAIDLYLRFSAAVEKDSLADLYYQVGRLYELTFRNSFAADYYRTSIAAGSFSDPALELHILKLQYEAGNIPEQSEIDALLMKDISSDFYVDALLFKAQILQYLEEWDSAESLLVQSRYSNLYPEIQFALWELNRRRGNRSEETRVLQFMKDTYPDSIEFAIMEGRSEKITRISDFFLSTVSTTRDKEFVPDPVYIQTGVFSEENNAAVQAEELRSSGFDSFINKYNNLFKVIVSGEDEVILLNSLKDKGFNGFAIDFP